MKVETARERVGSLVDLGTNLRAVLADLFAQEFAYSTGYLAAILNGCLFAPSLLTFWLVNGLLDFSSAIAIGAVTSAAGLQLRLLAYVLLVPTFLFVRVGLHLLHPVHRAQVLAGSCPNTRFLSLDWFSMGILATGLPLALQNLGPWVGMNAVFFVGVFVLPRVLPEQRASAVKLLAIVFGGTVFLYANYGGALPLLPPPSAVLGPIATLGLDDTTTRWLVRLVNSVAFGPLLVAAFGIFTNRVLTRPELTTIPFVRQALPRRDPDTVVATSAALGTVFYFGVVAAATGHLVVLP